MTAQAEAPEKILFDGRDVTGHSRISSDPSAPVAPVAINLPSPLERGAYCCLQAVYPSGARATELIKVWSDEPAYGMWGGRPGKEGDTVGAKAYFDDLALHNGNRQTAHALNARPGRFMLSSMLKCKGDV